MELASKLLQDNYKSWQAPSALTMFPFALRGPQPPHKAIRLRSCWEHTNKLCSVPGLGKPHVQSPWPCQWLSVFGSSHAKAQDPEEE